MPANKRPRSLNYWVNKKWPKTWKKVNNTICHYKKLLKRLEFEGETKWLKNAIQIVLKKVKKYQININKI